MTVVNYATGELLDTAAAERRAERITLRLDAIADNYAAVMPMIREAIEKRDDMALGYRSPGEYVSDRFGGSLQRLGVDVRRAVVGELTAAGLSTRAIAPVVGVTQKTVVKDMQSLRAQVIPEVSPAETPEPGEASTASTTIGGSDERGAAIEQPVVPLAPVVGIDGKAYTRPDRKMPRPAAEKTLNTIAYHLEKAAREAKSLTSDQTRRLKPKADLWTVGLRESVEVLQDLLTSLTEEK